MKKITKVFLTIILAAFILLPISCNNSYEQMLEDFNGKYFTLTRTPPKECSITDSDFAPENMLEVRYTFLSGYESTLVAPGSALKYKWNKCTKAGGLIEPPLCTGRIYNFIPEEDFVVNEETPLVLTVTDTSGTEYIDITQIIVINRN